MVEIVLGIIKNFFSCSRFNNTFLITPLQNQNDDFFKTREKFNEEENDDN